MRLFGGALLFLSSLLAMTASATQMLSSSSLNVCQENSGFTASFLNMTWIPSDGFATIDIISLSTIQQYVVFYVQVYAYGYPIIETELNPCKTDIGGFCPMLPGDLDNKFTIPVPTSAVSMIPGIAFTFPDIDASATIYINGTDGKNGAVGASLACLEASVTNGKTVDLVAVKWVLALIAGLALCASAFISGVLGHTNAASHVAASALSLVSYFQAQAIVGLTGISLPPAAMAWLQNFQWSMGIVNVGFLQTIYTWYQRATGGTPSQLLNTDETTSVEVRKRSFDPLAMAATSIYQRAAELSHQTGITERLSNVMKRGNIQTSYGSYVVYGIQRVAYLEDIESTNLFLTCMMSFIIVLALTALLVTAFKFGCDLAVKRVWVRADKFEFRHNFKNVLKGILFRITLIGYAPMMLISFWEFTQDDSAAIMLLAVFFILAMNIILGWGTFKVIQVARRSVALYKNPAYVLFSNSDILDKWGFLYIQWRASAYYFVGPLLGYMLVKSLFVAFAQHTGIAQAIGLMIIEGAALVTASVMRPWMDKKTNSFNISIFVINFLNAVFLLIFTEVFDQPRLVTSIVGVVLWILNTIFTLVLLIMLIVSTVIVFMTENPDGRYKFMADDRTSFMKSASHINTTTELDALGAAARGGNGNIGYKPRLDLEDEDEGMMNDNMSITSDAMRRRTVSPPLVSAAGSTVSGSRSQGSHMTAGGYHEVPRQPSPISPSVPMFPSEGSGDYLRSASPGGNRGPATTGYQQPAWQRGAGYDH